MLPRTASAVALDAVETRSLHRNEFEQLLKDNPAVERFLTSVLAEQVRRLSGQLLDALYTPADQGVVRRLVEVVDLYAGQKGAVEIPLKQEDLASMAGTTRPTDNRVVKQLETDGVLTASRGQLLVLDPGALRKRAR